VAHEYTSRTFARRHVDDDDDDGVEGWLLALLAVHPLNVCLISCFSTLSQQLAVEQQVALCMISSKLVLMVNQSCCNV